MKIKLEKEQKLFFGFILILCIIALGIAIYLQFFMKKDEIQTYKEMSTAEEEELKTNFSLLFDNQIHRQDTQNKEEFVKTNYQKQETQDGDYELNVSIPQINLPGEIIKNYNNEIVTIFQAKAESVLKQTEVNTVYEVKYVAFFQDNILSLAIKSILKEGNNPQRVILKTFNYNVVEAKEISIQQIIEKKNLKQDTVEKKIINEIKWKNHQAEQLEQTGYQVYKRDVNSEQYQFDKIDNFFLDQNGKLYILYAYGNNKITSELDIIIF